LPVIREGEERPFNKKAFRESPVKFRSGPATVNFQMSDSRSQLSEIFLIAVS
jgi:hypothetical protein